MPKTTTESITEHRDRIKYFNLFKVHSDLLINNNAGNANKIQEINELVTEIHTNLNAFSNEIFVNKSKILAMCKNLKEKYGNEVDVMIEEVKKLPLQIRK